MEILKKLLWLFVDNLVFLCAFTLVTVLLLGEEATVNSLGLSLMDFIIIDVVIGVFGIGLNLWLKKRKSKAKE
jgi:hypothetical protein